MFCKRRKMECELGMTAVQGGQEQVAESMPGQHVSYGGAADLYQPGTVGGQIPQEQLAQQEPGEVERRRLAVRTAPGPREAPPQQGGYGIQSDTFNPMVRPRPVNK